MANSHLAYDATSGFYSSNLESKSDATFLQLWAVVSSSILGFFSL